MAVILDDLDLDQLLKKLENDRYPSPSILVPAKEIDDFLKQLDKIEHKERKWTSILENEIKNLTDMRAKKIKKEVPQKEARGSFIKTINSLRKIGYPILLKENTMEEFSYMIKAAREDAKE